MKRFRIKQYNAERMFSSLREERRVADLKVLSMCRCFREKTNVKTINRIIAIMKRANYKAQLQMAKTEKQLEVRHLFAYESMKVQVESQGWIDANVEARKEQKKKLRKKRKESKVTYYVR